MQESVERRYIEEDEIDLRELFKTIWNRKLFIATITVIITILAIIYALYKTPIYEATALVEIGNYKLNNNNNNNNNKVQLDNANQLSKKLNVLFVDMLKNKKDKKAEIISIKIPKKQNNFLEIKSQSVSNKLARNEIEKVIEYIQKKHKLILDDVKSRREFEISNIDENIKTIQGVEVTLLQDKILILEKSLVEDKKYLKKINLNIKENSSKNPTLAAISLIQVKNLRDSINDKSIKLLDLKNEKQNLVISKVNNLIEEKNFLKSMLLPYNYKNTEVVGEIITNDYPIKPKKMLIVVVAFITGFILSIFLVFFLEFIKGFKEESTQ